MDICMIRHFLHCTSATDPTWIVSIGYRLDISQYRYVRRLSGQASLSHPSPRHSVQSDCYQTGKWQLVQKCNLEVQLRKTT